MVTLFNHLKNCETVFQSTWTILHSRQLAWGSRFPHISTYYYLFLIMDIGVWSNTSLWFWFAFSWWLMTQNIFFCAYWPFVYLSRNVCSTLCPFLIELFVLLSYKTSLYILYTKCLSDRCFANIFSHSVFCLFISWKWPLKQCNVVLLDNYRKHANVHNEGLN